MADVQPLTALHYDLDVAGPLDRLIAPPYDVIDPAQRAELVARSPYNVVGIDLPAGEPDPYAEAARLLGDWQQAGAVVRDSAPALWALEQSFTGPDGVARTRRGIFARVRVEEYGPGRIRPHERTHPGPKEDRLRLTRATRANLSPIFSLYADPAGAAWAAVEPATRTAPWGEATDDDGTTHRLFRVGDPTAIAAAQDALREAELLIADGHHRYETARVFAAEDGAPAGADHVLMLLVALEDPGLAVFPTHRLVTGLRDDPVRQEALAATLREHFHLEPVGRDELVPKADPATPGPLVFGYLDSHFRTPYRCTLKDQAIADAALPGLPEAYRTLDTAVLEALVLMGPLGLTEDDISHLRGLGYSRTDDEALQLVESGTYDCAFFLRPSPVSQVQAVAAAGVNMPPKSTFFSPKVPTGLLFNPLD